VGLNKKTIKHLNSSAGGSFMHITAEHAKDKIAKPKILPEPSQSLALAIVDPEPPKEEKTLILDFMLEFEDELFNDYGNTSRYHMMKKPQEYKNPSFIDPSEKEFFKKATKELVSVLSDKWLEE
jgi:hypothetical protein